MSDDARTTDPRRRYRLLAPLIQAGTEHAAGSTALLRPDQAARLAEQGVIDVEAPAKPGRARKLEG